MDSIDVGEDEGGDGDGGVVRVLHEGDEGLEE